MRGKPYVVSVDDNLLFFNASFTGTDLGDRIPFFAFLSKDNKTIWGAVL